MSQSRNLSPARVSARSSQSGLKGEDVQTRTAVVQMFTHASRSSGAFERIAEITGPDGEHLFIVCDYRGEEEVARAVASVLGLARNEVYLARTVEPVTSAFADFRRWARSGGSEAAEKIRSELRDDVERDRQRRPSRTTRNAKAGFEPGQEQ
jgi:hypothetical protein